jgi:hypothetical protein
MGELTNELGGEQITMFALCIPKKYCYHMYMGKDFGIQTLVALLWLVGRGKRWTF